MCLLFERCHLWPYARQSKKAAAAAAEAWQLHVQKERLARVIVNTVVVVVDVDVARGREDGESLDLLVVEATIRLEKRQQIGHERLADDLSVGDAIEVDRVDTLDGGIEASLVVALEHEEAIVAEGRNV